MKYILFFIMSFFIFQGCTSKKQIPKPKNVEDIKVTKINKRFSKVNVLEKDLSSKYLKVFLNNEDKIKYICTNNSKCDYFNKKKHHYTQNSDVTEDIVYIYENGYSPDFSKNISGIQCGRGSLAGYFVVLNTKALKNHNKDNLKYCYNRFTKLDSMQLFEKVGISLLTFGTSILTSGNMHTVKFDENEFKEAIVDSNLDKFKNSFLALIDLNNSEYGYDVIYINSDDVKASLSEAYDRLIKSKHKRDGVVFIDEKTMKTIKIITFRNYNNINLISSISSQINDLLNAVKFNEQKNAVTYSDLVKYIPPKIKKPLLPELPKLTKDEFETQKEFKERVYTAVKKRESRIKELQKQYNLDILKRNEYINSLESSYKNYLNNLFNQTNKLQEDLKNSLDILSQILFIQNTQGFDAKDFKYNAETQRLYFKVFTKNGKYTHNAFSKIPAKYAKKIKLKESFRIEPLLKYKNRFLNLKGFYIYEIKSLNRYKVIYTNKNYTPISQRVVIKTNQEKIKALIESRKLSKFKQKKSKIVSKNYSEIWYIDVVNRMNEKVPNWFSSPNMSEKLIAYAQAETLEEAKVKALHDLALMNDAKVSAIIKSTNQFGNSVENYKSLKKSIVLKTNTSFEKNEYRVFKQEKVDGIWYVALILK